MATSVSFVVIGAQKSGTTSLSFQLAQHSQIGFCDRKEPDFFSKSRNWVDELDSYHELFPQEPGKVWGEASTTYTWFPEYPETAQRLATYNPDLKLIYIMRHPIERIRSHYTYELLKGRANSPEDVDMSVLEDPMYVNRSRYGVQLAAYLDHFPKRNLLPIIFEEYVADPLRTLRQVALHLDIVPDEFGGIDFEPQNRSEDRLAERKIKKQLAPLARFFPLGLRNMLKGPFVYRLDRKIGLSTETQTVLWRLLDDDVVAVEKLLERRIDIWRDASANDTFV